MMTEDDMKSEEQVRKEIVSLAQQTLHMTNLLIRQCDRWLPEEEGRKNVEKRFRERERERRVARRKKLWNTIKGVFGIRKLLAQSEMSENWNK